MCKIRTQKEGKIDPRTEANLNPGTSFMLVFVVLHKQKTYHKNNYKQPFLRSTNDPKGHMGARFLRANPSRVWYAGKVVKNVWMCLVSFCFSGVFYIKGITKRPFWKYFVYFFGFLSKSKL